MNLVYVIVHDTTNETERYFIRLGIGIFWECGARERAKEFTSRALAVKTMQRAGKHRQGWRVIADVPMESKELSESTRDKQLWYERHKPQSRKRHTSIGLRRTIIAAK